MSQQDELFPTPGGEAKLMLRARVLFEQRLHDIACDTDRRFAVLAAAEWLAVTVAALWIAPLSWTGSTGSIHPHVWMAVGLGGLVTGVPIFLAWSNAGHVLTRHVIAASQMLMAGLLVHMLGGRIETHFAYFGLLSFLAFYRDWRVLLTATGVAGLDHVLRAILWPESLYGVPVVPLWRALEHIGWVVFEVGFLTNFTLQSCRAMFVTMQRQARLEGIREETTATVRARTAELADSERRYRMMFESSPLPMWLCDAESGMFVAVNKQALRKYGYSEEEFLHMHTFDIRPPEDVEGFKTFLQNLTDEVSPMSQWRHCKKDGTIMDVEVTSHSVAWEGRRAMLVVPNDITDRKQAERERASMELQLRHSQKMESIGQLAAGIAHEINTPTQYIGDNLHFLRDSFRDLQTVNEALERALPGIAGQPATAQSAVVLRQAMADADTAYLLEEVPKAISQAIDGVDRVSTLVRAMKEFSHPGEKMKVPANLNSAIQSTITVARNEWKYVAEVETEFDPLLPLVPCLVSDLNQVVLNLIVNAAQAISEASPGGAFGKIIIRTLALAGWVEIQVQDSGPGIPLEARSRIFDPFFTTKEVGKGTGQGLAIARSVVVGKHGGSIHFETGPGGTTFFIRLPLDGAGVNGTPEEAELVGSSLG